MKPFLIITYADLAALPDLRARYQPLLSEYRTRKMDRQKGEADRDRGELAEYCLIEALLRYDRDLSLPLMIRTRRYGKPYFADIPVEFSLSHAGEYAAAAISDKPVGIDIERIRPVRERLAKRICTDREWDAVWLRDPGDRTFLELFSAKESIVKRSGQGLSDLAKADTADYPVRQKWISDYLLSVCSERVAEEEVVRICGPEF